MKVTNLLRSRGKRENLKSLSDQYQYRFAQQTAELTKQRVEQSSEVSQEYYRLATDFYLQGWGRSFHFGVRHRGESLKESILQYEYYLADSLRLKPGQKCLDLGCGVGGPMINISKRYGTSILGINNSSYQIHRGREFVRKENVMGHCRFLECDWMDIPLQNESFDHAYAFEATCHASENRADLFREIHRLIKPGGRFAAYEWVLTDKYDPMNPKHRNLKHELEIGNGISALTDGQTVKKALEEAGFKVTLWYDRAHECDTTRPWWGVFTETGSIRSLRKHRLGRAAMTGLIKTLVASRVVPKEAVDVHKVLTRSADALVEAGREGIFTPMQFFVAEKPE